VLAALSLAAALPTSSPSPSRRERDASDASRSSRRASAVTAALLVAVVAVDALAGGGSAAVRGDPSTDSAPPLATLLRHDEGPTQPPPPPSPSRAGAVAGRAAPAPLDAYLVTSVHDCASNLDALDLLARDAIAPRIRLAAALVVPARHHGDSRATDRATRADEDALRSVREAIAARGLPVPSVRPLDAPTALLLRRIGYRTTPFLVVVDSAGTLRFATPPALTFAGYRGLARTLTAIAADTP
jgi:hypothetical protein